MTDHSRRILLKGAAAGTVLSLLPGAASARAGDPVAATRHGKVHGFVDRGMLGFKGVPYGEDTAKTRFAAPRPPRPWSGVRDALAFGPRAPQGEWILKQFPSQTGPISEDCLYLNVWTPALRDGRRRAVMVHLHGGGFNSLSANDPVFDGVNLARRGDVVVVTLNHRLNIFGYLHLAELGGADFAEASNAGQLDILLALRWIRDNIEEFGGDPERVMLFGESGGGAKIACLMGMPSAMGLFHRAATASGETVTASKPETGTARAAQLLKDLGLPRERIGELRTLPMEEILAAAGHGYNGPVLDGRALPRHPFHPDAPAFSAHIPLMVGTTLDESRMLIGRADPATFELDWATLPAALARYADKMGALDLNAVIALYRRVNPGFSASDIFFAATTDSRDWRPAVVEIERRAALTKAAPTWSHELHWRSPVDPKMRAHHALDVTLMMDNVALSNRFTGTGPEAYAMAAIMSDTYIAFAKTGNPNNTRIPNWPAYDLKRRATMALDLASRVIDDPRSEARKLFSTVPYENPGT